MPKLYNKHIIVGISGGIAAYKSAELVRGLRREGAEVRVVMTRAAKEFITPMTLQALSANPVHDNLLDADAEAAMGHIELARWADAIVIAPATAHTIAQLAGGQAGDLLTTLCLASAAKRLCVPAMNQNMWSDASTQDNIKRLESNGYEMVGPTYGGQACGDIGFGRMQEPDDIIEAVIKQFDTGILSGKRVLITAGPTHEAIDPVRYIANKSSGKMAYALAEAARDAGARVILVSGPVSLETPSRVQRIDVLSGHDMFEAVDNRIIDCDVFIAAAAVCDYRAEEIAAEKVKKTDDSITLHLRKNTDILAQVSARKDRPICVGFAAETQHLIENATRKLKHKACDMIVANLVSGTNTAFGGDNNEITLLTASGQHAYPYQSKAACARVIIEFIVKNILNH